MADCAEYRLSHSQFLEWDQSDRDKAIWWKIRQGETCPNCGTREAEWLPSAGGSRSAYRPEIRRCRGCEVREQLAETEDAKQGRGVYIVMKRRDLIDG